MGQSTIQQQIDLSSLSAEELQNELKKRQDKQENDRKAYKQMVNEQLPKIMIDIQKSSSLLSATKLKVFESLKTLLDFKMDVYDVRATQQSHTFSDAHGNSIVYGFRTVDKWDDTVNEGISKVNNFIGSLAKDDDTARLVGMINNLLKKDSKGNLKANRVLELIQLADDFDNADFTDGVNIIRKAYKPEKSAYFIEAYYLNAQGKKKTVPLSISAVDFPEGTDVAALFPVDDIYADAAKKEDTPAAL